MSDRFASWLRGQRSERTLDETARKLLRARIDERQRQRQRSRRNWIRFGLATLAAVLVLGGLGIDPLGSYNRDLIQSRDRDDVMVSPLSDGYLGYKIDEQTSVEFWETMRELRAARLRSLHGVGFSEFNGKTHWTVTYRYLIDGEEQIITERPRRGPASTADRQTMLMVVKYIDEFHGRITAGTALELPARRVEVDGHEVWLRVWQMDTPDGIYRIGMTASMLE